MNRRIRVCLGESNIPVGTKVHENFNVARPSVRECRFSSGCIECRGHRLFAEFAFTLSAPVERLACKKLPQPTVITSRDHRMTVAYWASPNICSGSVLMGSSEVGGNPFLGLNHQDNSFS
jgi:hypothetical protein